MRNAMIQEGLRVILDEPAPYTEPDRQDSAWRQISNGSPEVLQRGCYVPPLEDLDDEFPMPPVQRESLRR